MALEGQGMRTVREAETRGVVDASVVMLAAAAGAAAEQYRVLSQRIAPAIAEGARRIGIASPLPGDGRTTAAINVALALSQAGRHRVALVDADLRRPSIAGRLGLVAELGLGDVAEERCALDAALWRFGVGELHVLPAGATNTPHRAVAAPALAAALRSVSERADVVVLDMPPVLEAADAILLAGELDALVWVVRAGRTPMAALRRALERMPHARHLGVVLIGTEARWSSTPRLPTRSLPALSLPALPALERGKGR